MAAVETNVDNMKSVFSRDESDGMLVCRRTESTSDRAQTLGEDVDQRNSFVLQAENTSANQKKSQIQPDRQQKRDYRRKHQKQQTSELHIIQEKVGLYQVLISVLPASSSVTEHSSVAPDGLWILASIRPLAPFSWTAKEASCPTFRPIS